MTDHPTLAHLLRDGKPADTSTVTATDRIHTHIYSYRLDPTVTEGMEDARDAAVITTITTRHNPTDGGYVTTASAAAQALHVSANGRPSTRRDPSITHRVALRGLKDGHVVADQPGSTRPTDDAHQAAHARAVQLFHDNNG